MARKCRKEGTCVYIWASLVAQLQRICLQFRRYAFDPWEDPLEEEMATHSSILAEEIPSTEEPGGYVLMGPQELDTT